jgi:hypothetical protein
VHVKTENQGTKPPINGLAVFYSHIMELTVCRR